jgi:uncharacterized membrane protein YraQ (UPF0718 family)
MESIYYRFLNHYQGSHTRLIINEAVALFINLWPYLVSGILLTTVIKIFLDKERITLYFQHKINASIPLAALIGIMSPLGSYIIIPLAAALFLVGLPPPVLMALLVSSPLIDPNLFLITSGAFGLKMAFARLVSAYMLGISAGYLTKWLLKFNQLSDADILCSRNITSVSTTVDPVNKKTPMQFFHELYRMTLFIGKYFMLSIILAAAIRILTPPNLLIRLFKGNTFLTVLLSAGAGIPFYVCGGAAIPVVEQLAELGMSKGAVLAFFISGPVTKISNLILMSSIFRLRIFLIYLLTGITGAIILGILFNLFT